MLKLIFYNLSPPQKLNIHPGSTLVCLENCSNSYGSDKLHLYTCGSVR